MDADELKQKLEDTIQELKEVIEEENRELENTIKGLLDDF